MSDLTWRPSSYIRKKLENEQLFSLINTLCDDTVSAEKLL